jgi:hypothetical protein
MTHVIELIVRNLQLQLIKIDFLVISHNFPIFFMHLVNQSFIFLKQWKHIFIFLNYIINLKIHKNLESVKISLQLLPQRNFLTNFQNLILMSLSHNAIILLLNPCMQYSLHSFQIFNPFYWSILNFNFIFFCNLIQHCEHILIIFN